MRSRSCCLTSRSLARMRLRIVVRRTMNRPNPFFPLMCVKPRKSNVSGLPSPLRLPSSIKTEFLHYFLEHFLILTVRSCTTHSRINEHPARFPSRPHNFHCSLLLGAQAEMHA